MPRNVLMIVVDQWRGDMLPCLGADWLHLPNVQRLCSEGVTFRNHFAQAAPCGPARSSLLTGLYLMNHRHVRNTVPLDHRHTNIALEVRKVGYEPALIGYTDTTPDPRHTPPDDPDYRRIGATMPDWFPFATQIAPARTGYFSWVSGEGFELPSTWDDIWLPKDGNIFGGASSIPAALSDTAWSAEMALSYLRERADRKWLLHVGFHRPHPPFIAPEPYNSAHHPDDMPGPIRAPRWQEEAAQHPLLADALESTQLSDFLRGANGLVRDLSEEKVRAVRAGYCGLMSEIDDQLGRIFSFLEEQCLWDDTLIFFTSDHGEHLGDHYLFGKDTYFDQTFRIPLIIRDPSDAANGTRGNVVDHFTESIDVMPTILDWIGAEIPRTCDGVSLIPLLSASADIDGRDAAHFEYDFRDTATEHTASALGVSNDEASLCAVRGARYKYIPFAALPPLLFDLAEDPNEFNNLAQDERATEAALACAQAMLSWRLTFAERTLTGYRTSYDRGLIEMP